MDFRGHGAGRAAGYGRAGASRLDRRPVGRDDQHPHRHRPDPDDVSAARAGARLSRFMGCETRIFDPSNLPLTDQVDHDDHPASDVKEMKADALEGLNALYRQNTLA
ncbi:hypothetical protein HMPREF0185_01639 [Brevundimonas diminuta 470-4]|nr:hypothetical protein HMPREF0185_01639 [Brevundimonas diminuta 470-4]